jgi:hypothetical protein
MGYAVNAKQGKPATITERYEVESEVNECGQSEACHARDVKCANVLVLRFRGHASLCPPYYFVS